MRFDFFRGAWTIKGRQATHRDACAWLPGTGFLACNAEDRSESPPAFSMSLFGYSEADARYTCSGFSGSGTQRGLQGSMEDGVWRFHGQSGRGPKARRWQATVTPAARGFRVREEVSERSRPWRESVVLECVRVPEADG